MANGDSGRLQQLEDRIAALEGGGQSSGGQSGSGTVGGGQSSGGTVGGGQSGGGTSEGQVSPFDAAAVQAFMQGALAGASFQQSMQAQGQEGAGAQFLSIFSCPSGGGWSPTKYDSFFWCKSRFMCNPQSLSCLC